MSVKALIDVTSTDHIVGDNDLEIKLVRDTEGDVAVIFAVEDIIVQLSPVDQLLSYLTDTILEDSKAFLEREEPKAGWRQKNKD